jgi:DNA invertase Pin-like site-specific DNA recombinase
MLRAQQHYAAGWKPTKIRELLTDEGHPVPSLNTIYQWVNPAYRERHRRSTRAAKARAAATGAAFRLPSNGTEYQRAFMRRLREDGVSCNAIAKVCSIVFGIQVTEHQVRYALGETTRPEPPRRRTAAAA